MSFYLADTIIRPLKRLTQTANEIANGNLQINLDYNSKDEVGVLARSFEETTKQLNKRIEYINSLAYTDKLTNSKNSIGGDEFSVILKNTTEEFCQTLVERFYKEIAEKTQDIKISVAMGFGNYDSAIDESYESFFKRIDEEMYHNKKKMKALGEILN